jgi:hypothetical protein
MTSSGFFRTALDNIIAGRQREANRQVDRFLLMLSDGALREYGYNREQLRKAASPRL